MQLDHKPSGASSDPVESRRRELRRKLMAANYTALFGGEPLREPKPNWKAALIAIASARAAASQSEQLVPVRLGTVPPGKDPSCDPGHWVECRIMRSRGGPPLLLMLGLGATVDGIKRVLQDKLGIPVEHQCLSRCDELLAKGVLGHRIHEEVSSVPLSAIEAGRPLAMTLLVLSGSMPLTVKTLTGQLIALQIEPEMTVDELKFMIQRKEGVPTEQQRIIFAGKW